MVVQKRRRQSGVDERQSRAQLDSTERVQARGVHDGRVLVRHVATDVLHHRAPLRLAVVTRTRRPHRVEAVRTIVADVDGAQHFLDETHP